MASAGDVKSIFLAASEKPLAERAAFVDEATAGDAALLARVEALLKAHDNPDSFLDVPAAEFGATIDLSPGEPPLAERPGTLIGPYKLLQQIGEGGMGVVFMAEQTEPIQRTVALKIIKPGMDTRQVIARFEAERQAVAMMDHHNIARVLDAGTTDTGRPYFVMDLVKGVPITEYCDRQHLPIRARLELMATVCHAVQHAHQKGIIHRDLKPSNVLVAEYDGRPVPKVIDFGVAKATAQRLTEKTMFTEYGQLIGTFEYMSPEQARFNQLDVDTRSDIYSLGVLLYEVLAGSTPLEKERLRSAAYDEVLRIICEEEPQRLSLRLSSSQALPSISAQRQIEPAKLKTLVRGELDWIVMKCLEKDRNRRYNTANSLAVDIQRYLNDEPVEARRPTRIYRLRKFIRRNKAGVLTGSAIVLLLVSTVVVQAVNNTRIRRESAARAIALKAKESSLATIREAVQQMARLESQTQGRLSEIPGGDEVYRALQEDTLRYYLPIINRAEIDGETNYEMFVLMESVADIQREHALYDDARKMAQRCIDVVQKKLGTDPDNPIYLADLGRAKECMLRVLEPKISSENEQVFMTQCNELLDARREFNRRWPENLQPMAYCLKWLSDIALNHGDKATAEQLMREGVECSKGHLRQAHSLVGEWENASWMAIALGRLLRDNDATGMEEAASMFDQSRQWAQESLKEHSSRLMRYTAATAELELGICHSQRNRAEQAVPLMQHAAAEFRRLSLSFPSDSQTVGSARWAQGTLVRLLQQLGRADEAADAARNMADWRKEIAARTASDVGAQKELRQADAEVMELLHATGQEN